jgi:hypothetical protein
MARHVRQSLIAGAAIAALLILTVGAVPASAAIADKAFTVMGCNVGDYNCYYSKMGGGSPDAYYCQSGYYQCTSGVIDPVTRTTTAGPETNYCVDGAAYTQNGIYGCVNGNPIGAVAHVSSDPNNVSGNGGPTVIIAGNFANAGLGVTNVTGAAKQQP